MVAVLRGLPAVLDRTDGFIQLHSYGNLILGLRPSSLSIFSEQLWWLARFGLSWALRLRSVVSSISEQPPTLQVAQNHVPLSGLIHF